MATRYGYDIYLWLLERGWEAASEDDEVIGDPRLVDRISGDELSPYEALALHTNRTGEVYLEDL